MGATNDSAPGNRRMLAQSPPWTYPLKALKTSQATSRRLIRAYRAAQTPFAPRQAHSMQAFATHQQGHFRRIRAFDDALLGHNGIDQISRRHIEDRIERFDIRTHPLPAHFQ